MFGRKQEDKPVKSSNIDSLIGENIKLIGKLEGKGNLRIDGTIEGDIDYQGDITLGETGRVEGNIICHNLIGAGYIKGNVIAEEGFTLLPTGSLIGDMEVKSLIIHESARFEGQCKMIPSAKDQEGMEVKEIKKAKDGA